MTVSSLPPEKILVLSLLNPRQKILLRCWFFIRQGFCFSAKAVSKCHKRIFRSSPPVDQWAEAGVRIQQRLCLYTRSIEVIEGLVKCHSQLNLFQSPPKSLSSPKSSLIPSQSQSLSFSWAPLGLLVKKKSTHFAWNCCENFIEWEECNGMVDYASDI